MHLKVIQQMSKMPRPPVGVPPLSDEGFNEALAVGAAASSSSTMPSYDDDGRINPLAGMGLSDERYQAILKDLVSSENLMGVGVPEGFAAFEGMEVALDVGVSVGVGEKRGMDEDAGEMREGKRGRFEILE